MNLSISRRLRAFALVSLTVLAACSSEPSETNDDVSSVGTGEATAQSGPGATFRPTEAVALTGQLGISTLRIIVSEHAADRCAALNVDYGNTRYLELNLTIGDHAVEAKTYDIESREADASLVALDEACEVTGDGVHADEGTVTVDAVTATSVRGTFSIILGDAPMKGAFDTSICDIDKAITKLPAGAKHECR